MKRHLVIFAKEPVAGHVKTRLAPQLGLKGSAVLYEAFLKDTFDLARRVDCHQRFVAYDAGNAPARFIRKEAHGFRFFKQTGKNLGERMHNTFARLDRRSKGSMVIIGSDSPHLSVGFIQSAFERLLDSDVVIGPSIDGGYYLVGLNRPCREIFEDIPWSSNKVLDRTIKTIKKIKKKCELLPLWYDVDDQNSLRRLGADLKNAKPDTALWTREFLIGVARDSLRSSLNTTVRR